MVDKDRNAPCIGQLIPSFSSGVSKLWLPLGFKRRNQSSFCLLVMMLLGHGSMIVTSVGNSKGQHDGLRPFSPIDGFEFLQHDLDFSTVGSTHGQKVETLQRAGELRTSTLGGHLSQCLPWHL